MENTFEFETPEHHHKVVMRSWITFLEKRKLHEFYAESMPKDSTDNVKSNNYLNASTDKAVELVLVSIDGKTTDLLKEFYSLANRDSNEIVRRVNDVIADAKKEPATPKI